MPTTGGPGQQAIPGNQGDARDAPTGKAAPASSAPSSNRPTSEGAISNAAPVAASAMAAAGSTRFSAVPGISLTQGLGGFVAGGQSLTVSLSILPVNLNGAS